MSMENWHLVNGDVLIGKVFVAKTGKTHPNKTGCENYTYNIKSIGSLQTKEITNLKCKELY